MVKKFILLLRLSVLGLVFSQPGLTLATTIDTIDVEVKLQRDGTALIRERWKVDIDNTMTEWYLSLANLKGMEVTNFRVYDNDKGAYMTDDTPWRSKRTRADKAGKSGVVKKKNDSYELCWGIGTWSKHYWTAEYQIKGFIKQFSDGCGFNHCFVSSGLSSVPKYIRTTISMADSEPLSFGNARIWAFRYPGTCKFVNGKIVAESLEALDDENAMIIMCIFPPDAFHSPNLAANDTIGTMKWRALEGSDYLNDYSEADYNTGKNVLWKHHEDTDLKWYEYILRFLAIIVIAVLGALLAVLALAGIGGLFSYGLVGIAHIISLRPLRIYLRQRKLLKGASSKYYREIPVKGDLHRAFHYIDKNNYKLLPTSRDNLYAAYAVRLLRLKAISITSAKVGEKFASRMLIAENFDFSKQPDNSDTKALKTLYSILSEAAGKNLILEDGELECYLRTNKDKARLLASRTSADNIAPCTADDYQQIVGLRNFLEDFSIIGERGAMEVELWDEYLVFATLFGMADKVLNDFKKYYPNYFVKSIIGAQLVDQGGHVISNFGRFTSIADIGRHIHSSAAISSRSSGGGGRSSRGGGGGHSGGGGGGGR